MAGYVYFMGSRKDGPLYTGVTAEIDARVYQHKTGEGSQFCKRYGLTKLLYCEQYDRIEDAITREKQIKKWRRAWKNQLIESINPNWDDLYQTLMH